LSHAQRRQQHQDQQSGQQESTQQAQLQQQQLEQQTRPATAGARRSAAPAAVAAPASVPAHAHAGPSTPERRRPPPPRGLPLGYAESRWGSLLQNQETEQQLLEEAAALRENYEERARAVLSFERDVRARWPLPAEIAAAKRMHAQTQMQRKREEDEVRLTRIFPTSHQNAFQCV